MIKSALLLTIVCITMQLPVFAQSKVGTTAAPFLTIGAGARGVALGDAYTAMATGADALFWNPSGMAIPNDRFSEKGSVLFTNYDWFAGISYNAFGLTLPITRNGVLGLSYAMLNYGSIDVTTVDQQDGTGEKYNPTDMVVGLSYAQPLTTQFFIGGTVKYIRQRIWDMVASTVALDIGFTLVSDYWNGIRLGARLSNFGGAMQLSGVNSQIFIDPYPNNTNNTEQVPVNYYLSEWPLPIQFKFGIAVPVIKNKYMQWDILAESDQTNDQHLNADFGSEFRFMTNSTHFVVRGGYKDFGIAKDFKTDDVDSHLTFGAGLESKFTAGFRIGIDYAYVPFNNLGNVKMIDFRVYF